MNEVMIPSVPLTDAQLQEQYDIIAEVRPVILKWCDRIYGENRYKQFRYEYFSGQLPKYDKSRNVIQVGKKDRAQLERLQSVEVALLQHNIRLCMKISRYYYNRSKRHMPGVDFLDFLQEATMALIDSVYSYDGSTKFVTYVHWAINNRIKDFIRCDHPLSPPSPIIIELGNTVTEYMAINDCNFDHAVKQLGLSQQQCDNIRKVKANVISQNTSEDDNSFSGKSMNQIVDHRNSKVEDYDPLMLEALNAAGLSDIERTVFDAYLMNEKSYQSRIAEERGVSRQAVNSAFIRAKNKLRERYFELAPSEAENYVAV
jgi:RNA polymerase sigma factor (sigma-70 family)